MLNISIIIVTFNSEKDIIRCLDSIYRNETDLSFEVVVVDSKSTDETIENVKKYDNARLIALNENVGFARANNIALEQISGEYIFYLNPDTIIQKDTLKKLYYSLKVRENEGIGMIGPKILLSNGKVQYEGGRDYPSLVYSFFELFLLRRIFPNLCGGMRLEYWDHTTSREVPCLLGAAMFLLRETAMKLKGFDSPIPMYYEDIDFCFRLKKMGYKIYYDANIEITHFCGQSASTTISKIRLGLYVMELCYAPYLFFKKHFGSIYALTFRVLVFFGAIFRMTVILLGGSLCKLLRKNNSDFSFLTLLKYLEFLKWSVTLKVIKLK